MATITEKKTMAQETIQRARRIDEGGPSPKPMPPRRFGAKLKGVSLLGVLIVLVAFAALGSTHFYGSLGEDVALSVSTYRVEPGELIVTVTEDGNVESASNIDIKCQVAGGSSILWIVEDGKTVNKGDKLVELDASALEDQINTQKITYNKARSTVIQAQKNYDVAQISVQEYLEGTLKKELQDAEALITIAQENLRSAQNSLEYSERMFQRGYISSLELESQQFAVQRAQLELDSAKTARDVLVKFTKLKMLEDLKSQVETAKATMESEQAAFQLEEAKLKRLETQLQHCIIYAPQDGMAVYANDRGGRFGQQSATVEEGAAVREQQPLLRLPDLSQMQVKVSVHETKVEDLGRNMRARINVQGRELHGIVTNTANQPEPSSWFSGNVKEYATTVRIDGEPQGLKPGMTAEVEILVAHLRDVLTVPISAVVEQRGRFFCWVQGAAGSLERRPVVLGLTNDQFVEVKDGLKEGDEVVRNPRAVLQEAQKGVDVEKIDVAEKFGAAPSTPQESEPQSPPDARPTGPTGPPGADAPDADRPQPSDRPRGGGRRMGDLMQHDSDGDGKVSKQEAPERMQSFFDRVDANADGYIDQSEVDQMRRRFQGGGGRPERGN